MKRKPISAKMRYVVLSRDGFACQCCGAKAPNVTLQVDHIVPIFNGGSDDERNLRAICVTCNIGKGAEEPNVISIGQAGQKYPIRIADNEVAVRGEELSQPMLWIGRQWAVTACGVECRDGTYVIEKERLWEDEPDWGWLKHMAEKDWVDMCDFSMAIAWARTHYAHLKNRKSA